VEDGQGEQEEIAPGEPGGVSRRLTANIRWLTPLGSPVNVRGVLIYSLSLANLAATEAFGRRLGELLFPGAVVALIGPLGAGKTHLVRAVAEGLGVKNPAAVNSPTFVLIQEYPARLPIYHFDAYRLSGSREFGDLGVTEYFHGGGVCLIEWADKVEAALPAEHLRIIIEVVDENQRRFQIAANGEMYEQLLSQLI
jgi:tRNA threonylcarbamoyladenosine biosynthesis protein TsaE